MNSRQNASPLIVPVAGQDIAVKRVTPARLRSPSPPTLVFLHEGLGAIGMWKDFPDTLAAQLGCPALIYDRLGHGASGPETAPRDLGYFERQAYWDLPALLAACALRDVVLIGHSDGGTIALLHAGRFPVRAVVTAAAHVFVEPVSLTGVAAARSAWQDSDFPQRLARYHGDKTATMFAAWADMWDAPWFRDWSIVDDLPALTCPLLAVQGADDNYGTPAQLDTIAAGVSGPAETVLIPGCGHSPHIESRDTLMSLIRDFVEELLH